MGLGSAIRAPARDPVVDLVRLAAVSIVVVWHTTLSLVHVQDGRLVMPNPIDSVPGGWALTWVLQVMPVFFVVGGYVNLSSWRSCVSTRAFLRRRAHRLGRPLVPFLVAWGAVELALLATGYPPLAVAAPGILAPLWFLGVYAVVTALVPLTASLHERWGSAVVVTGALALLALDAARLAGAAPLAAVTTALVWLLCHQLGYLWRDGHLGGGRLAGARLAGGAVLGLALLTGPGPYPSSMVATPTQGSNLLPTTPPVVLVCLVQLGLVLAAGPLLSRVARRPGVRCAVVAFNAVPMTVFLWHMPAVALLVIAAERLLGPLPTQPDAAWWGSRPLWLAAVLVLLCGFVVLARRFEVPRAPDAAIKRGGVPTKGQQL